MVYMSVEKIEQIRQVAEAYAVKERARLERVSAEYWDRIRVTDPSRYKAKQEAKYLVKIYYGDLGCTETQTFDSLEACRMYVELLAKSNGIDNEYSYNVYGPNGNALALKLTWTPEVRIE